MQLQILSETWWASTRLWGGISPRDHPGVSYVPEIGLITLTDQSCHVHHFQGTYQEIMDTLWCKHGWLENPL